MYGFLWRLLPGPWPVRAAVAVLLLLAVVAALFIWGFPVLAPLVPFNDGTVGQ